jgi:hypothetical protein
MPNISWYLTTKENAYIMRDHYLWLPKVILGDDGTRVLRWLIPTLRLYKLITPNGLDSIDRLPYVEGTLKGIMGHWDEVLKKEGEDIEETSSTTTKLVSVNLSHLHRDGSLH